MAIIYENPVLLDYILNLDTDNRNIFYKKISRVSKGRRHQFLQKLFSKCSVRIQRISDKQLKGLQSTSYRKEMMDKKKTNTKEHNHNVKTDKGESSRKVVERFTTNTDKIHSVKDNSSRCKNIDEKNIRVPESVPLNSKNKRKNIDNKNKSFKKLKRLPKSNVKPKTTAVPTFEKEIDHSSQAKKTITFKIEEIFPPVTINNNNNFISVSELLERQGLMKFEPPKQALNFLTPLAATNQGDTKSPFTNPEPIPDLTSLISKPDIKVNRKIINNKRRQSTYSTEVNVSANIKRRRNSANDISNTNNQGNIEQIVPNHIKSPEVPNSKNRLTNNHTRSTKSSNTNSVIKVMIDKELPKISMPVKINRDKLEKKCTISVNNTKDISTKSAINKSKSSLSMPLLDKSDDVNTQKIKKITENFACFSKTNKVDNKNDNLQPFTSGIIGGNKSFLMLMKEVIDQVSNDLNKLPKLSLSSTEAAQYIKDNFLSLLNIHITSRSHCNGVLRQPCKQHEEYNLTVDYYNRRQVIQFRELYNRLRTVQALKFNINDFYDCLVKTVIQIRYKQPDALVTEHIGKFITYILRITTLFFPKTKGKYSLYNHIYNSEKFKVDTNNLKALETDIGTVVSGITEKCNIYNIPKIINNTPEVKLPNIRVVSSQKLLSKPVSTTVIQSPNQQTNPVIPSTDALNSISTKQSENSELDLFRNINQTQSYLTMNNNIIPFISNDRITLRRASENSYQINIGESSNTNIQEHIQKPTNEHSNISKETVQILENRILQLAHTDNHTSDYPNLNNIHEQYNTTDVNTQNNSVSQNTQNISLAYPKCAQFNINKAGTHVHMQSNFAAQNTAEVNRQNNLLLQNNAFSNNNTPVTNNVQIHNPYPKSAQTYINKNKIMPGTIEINQDNLLLQNNASNKMNISLPYPKSTQTNIYQNQILPGTVEIHKQDNLLLQNNAVNNKTPVINNVQMPNFTIRHSAQKLLLPYPKFEQNYINKNKILPGTVEHDNLLLRNNAANNNTQVRNIIQTQNDTVRCIAQNNSLLYSKSLQTYINKQNDTVRCSAQNNSLLYSKSPQTNINKNQIMPETVQSINQQVQNYASSTQVSSNIQMPNNNYLYTSGTMSQKPTENLTINISTDIINNTVISNDTTTQNIFVGVNQAIAALSTYPETNPNPNIQIPQSSGLRQLLTSNVRNTKETATVPYYENRTYSSLPSYSNQPMAASQTYSASNFNNIPTSHLPNNKGTLMVPYSQTEMNLSISSRNIGNNLNEPVSRKTSRKTSSKTSRKTSSKTSHKTNQSSTSSASQNSSTQNDFTQQNYTEQQAAYRYALSSYHNSQQSLSYHNAQPPSYDSATYYRTNQYAYQYPYSSDIMYNYPLQYYYQPTPQYTYPQYNTSANLTSVNNKHLGTGYMEKLNKYVSNKTKGMSKEYNSNVRPTGSSTQNTVDRSSLQRNLSRDSGYTSPTETVPKIIKVDNAYPKNCTVPPVLNLFLQPKAEHEAGIAIDFSGIHINDIITTKYSVANFLRKNTGLYNATHGTGPMARALMYDPHKRYEAWRFFTYMFVHIGYMHIAVNLLVQILLGISLEMVHKPWRIIIVYFTGVLAGSLATSIVDPKVYLAGASGGVYSLITAHIASVIMNWKQMAMPYVQLFVFLIITTVDFGTAIYNRYYLQQKDHIGYEAHFAGAAAGLLVGIFVLRNLERNSCEDRLRWISFVVFMIFGVTAILFHIFYPSYFPKEH